MRLTKPQNVRRLTSSKPRLEFAGDRGEQLEVTALETDIVRVRHLPQGSARLDRTWLVLDRNGEMPLAGRSRDDLSPFSLPSCKVTEKPDAVSLDTGVLQLSISLGDFAIRWATKAGQTLAADLEGRAYAYDLAGMNVFHYLHRDEAEHYYGFGEVSGELNKAGRRLRLQNTDALGYNAQNGGPLYKHFPFYITFNPETQLAFGLFYDNLASTTFDLGCEIDNYFPPFRSYQADDGDIDYYFIFGPGIHDVVEKFTRLTGRMKRPPRWSLGYMGSTMKYTEAADAQVQLKNFGEKCREHRIPCNLFHLSSGYTLGEDHKRYVFHWNRKRIPDPQAMVDDFHRNGMHLTANIKPALLTTHPRYNEVAQFGGFIQDAEKDAAQLCKFWGGQAAFLDFTNPATIDWWKTQVKEQLLAYGIDSTWNDNNEFEVWDDAARCNGFGNEIPVGLIRPLQTLMMLRASQETQLEKHPDERPFLISRAGCPGMQRFVQSWSGDNLTSWKTLKYNIPMGLGLGLSGMPSTGHDVGGFAGLRPNPELFVRWVQNGIFHPRFTIHSWKIDGSANEPWMYPKVLPIIRETLNFRYRLIPYLYNLMVEAAETGRPIIRPLVYEFPEDAHCIDESFDFMLGSALLVASVLKAGVSKREVYLPAGADWFDFYTRQIHSGGCSVRANAPLEHIPLFVRAGSLLPMGEVVHPLFHEKDDVRQVLVFPHRETGSNDLVLQEDDGHSLVYQSGAVTRIHIHMQCSSDSIELQPELIAAGYALPYTEIEFILAGNDPRPLKLDRASKHWQDNENQLHITWPVPESVPAPLKPKG